MALLENFEGWVNGLYEAQDVRVTQYIVKEIKSDNHLIAKRTTCTINSNNLPPFTIVGVNDNPPISKINDGKYLILNKNATAIAFELKKCSFGNVFYNINHFQPQNVIYEQIDKNGTLVTNAHVVTYKNLAA